MLETLENFSRSSHIDSGPFNGFWLSVDPESGDRAYIKSFEKKDLDTPAKLAKFTDEMNQLKLFTNPYVAGLLGMQATENQITLILEAPDENLVPLYDYVMKNGIYDEVRLKEFVLQLIEIMGYIRAKLDVNFCKLTFDTIYVDENGKIKKIYVTDFNSLILEHSPYMVARISPPELITTKKVGETGDVWFIGIITFFLSIRCFPFTGRTPEEIIKSVLNKHLSLPSSLSSQLQDFLKNSLTKNQITRLHFERIKEHDFLRCSDYPMKRAFSTSGGFTQQYGPLPFVKRERKNSCMGMPQNLVIPLPPKPCKSIPPTKTGNNLIRSSSQRDEKQFKFEKKDNLTQLSPRKHISSFPRRASFSGSYPNIQGLL